MKKLEDLVRTAVGVPVDGPAGAVKVVNVRFQPALDAEGGCRVGRRLQLRQGRHHADRRARCVMGAVAVLLIFFVARPMMKGALGGAVGGGSGTGAMSAGAGGTVTGRADDRRGGCGGAGQ